MIDDKDNKVKYIEEIMGSIKILGTLSENEMIKYFDDLYEKDNDVLRILSNYFNKKVLVSKDDKK